MQQVEFGLLESQFNTGVGLLPFQLPSVKLRLTNLFKTCLRKSVFMVGWCDADGSLEFSLGVFTWVTMDNVKMTAELQVEALRVRGCISIATQNSTHQQKL